MESVIRELRLAVRSLARSRSFTAVAVLCLALGIGLTSAMFSIVDAVLLEPLPYHRPERVTLVYNRFPAEDMEKALLSGHEYLDVRDRTESLESVAAVIPRFLNLMGEGEPERMVGARASASLFPLLGVRPAVGRTFTPEEDTVGKNDVVLLSHDLWHARFGGDRDVVGRKLVFDDQPFTVIGVLPEGFRFGAIEFDAWIPFAADFEHLPPRSARGLTVVTRLADGVSLEQARGDLERLSRRLREEYPQEYPEASGWELRMVRARDDLVGDSRPALLAMLGAVGLVLVIACANVANLLLARATARTKEVAIRGALGARPWRLARQFLCEGLVLSVAGAVLGLLLAAWIPRIVTAVDPARVPRLEEVGLDPSVVVFAFAIAALTTIAFGLVPLARSFSTSMAGTLKEGGKTSAAGSQGRRVRSGLVVAEVAVALVVLIGAALLIQSYRSLQRIDPGFRADGVLTFGVFLSPARYPDEARRAQLVQRLVERLSSLPGVSGGSAVSHLPLGPLDTTAEIRVEGRAPRPEEGKLVTGWRMATPGYFETMEIPVLQGRGFRAADDRDAAGVVVLDRDLAQRLFPDGEDPLGRRLALLRFDGTEDWRTVVGVAGHVKHRGLAEEGGDQLYVPYAQYPFAAVSFVLRAAAAPETLSPAVRSVVHELEPDLPILDLQAMEDYVAASVSDQKLNALLLGIFAAAALLLAVAGVYGVLAYSVAQRTQEFGIRLAMGAGRGDVVRLVAREALGLAALGLLVGLLAAVALVRVIESFLYGITATDVVTYLVSALALCALALLAGYLPALRATRTDPVAALRYE
jgi:putative ABC transport system permease protein